MQMDSRVILGGQQPDIVNALARGQQAGLAARESNVNRQYGGAAMQGDQNALAQLASVNPLKAQGMAASQQNMQMDREQMQLARERGRLQALEFASQLDANQRAQAAEELKATLSGGITAWQMARQQGNPAIYDQWLGQSGLPPEEFSFEYFPVAAAQAGGEVEGLLESMKPEEIKPGNDYERYAAREVAAGRQPLNEFEYEAQINATKKPLVANNINTGDGVDPRPLVKDPDTGFQRVWDEEDQTWRDEPVPGSEAASDAAGSARALELAQSNYNRKSEIVDRNIDNAITHVEKYGRRAVGVGSIFAALPETAARELQGMIDTVKANLGFEELQAMRDSSPTGGALGSITEREIAFLQAIQANLDTGVSPSRFLEIMKELKDGRARFAAERAAIMAGQGVSGENPPPSGGSRLKYNPATGQFE